MKVLKGGDTVSSYEAYAQTPHGRLRHELLCRYYLDFVRMHRIRWVVDIGGGSGLLLEGLLKVNRSLRAILMDSDAAMVAGACDRLKRYIRSGRVDVKAGSVEDAGKEVRRIPGKAGSILLSFNHVIEYVEDKRATLEYLRRCVPKRGYLGIMYLNNSHEAIRQLLFKDSTSGVVGQLAGAGFRGPAFGRGVCVNTEFLERCLGEALTPVCEYGLRCVADLKSREFVGSHYASVLRVDLRVGRLRDFWGLARYRLKFYRNS